MQTPPPRRLTLSLRKTRYRPLSESSDDEIPSSAHVSVMQMISTPEFEAYALRASQAPGLVRQAALKHKQDNDLWHLETVIAVVGFTPGDGRERSHCCGGKHSLIVKSTPRLRRSVKIVPVAHKSSLNMQS